jgi:hypothetical protein
MLSYRRQRRRASARSSEHMWLVKRDDGTTVVLFSAGGLYPSTVDRPAQAISDGGPYRIRLRGQRLVRAPRSR